ncbi:antA/AntB antirepressor family protein [Entomohabitans teleogrylli]|uniref:antA/AntB antirepressor family protein n=1 Tax=Entomohabitans teleogrylli TaxID=1384589 RepID=UPI00073D8819|nr:antA/AntB antirepressor family protein [Entomohabitans teleogrylli]
MKTQLIPVFNGTISNETTTLCNARDLHAFLGVGKVFAAWITSRIAEYGFIENHDYILLSKTGKHLKSSRGGYNRKDYHLTLDTAKELAMVERNEKGRQIRSYFIECEKRLREQSSSPSKSRQWDNRILCYQLNGVTVGTMHLTDDHIVISMSDHIQMLRRHGYLVINRYELNSLTIPQLMKLSFN